MGNLRIVVIGGGGQYALGLVEGLIDFGCDLLVGAHIVLFDVSDEHLPFVQAYGERVAREVGANVTFESTTDRRRAFDGADYLLSQWGPGGHPMQEFDERLPAEFGLQGNETVGIGGIFRALRVVPILRGMISDARELCPNAWTVNYTNPVQLVADAARRLGDQRFISVCDGWLDVVGELANFLEVEPGAIRIYPAGTNHAIWVMRVTVHGEDGYPLLRERLARTTPAELRARYEDLPEIIRQRDGSEQRRDDSYRQFLPRYRFNFQLRLFELYGLLPGPRYYPTYYFDQDAHIAAQQRPGYVSMATHYETLTVPRAYDDLDGRIARAVRNITSTRLVDRGFGDEFGVHVIAAIENDLRREFIVNVPNNGAVSNLPADAIVEVPAVVGRDGAHPLALGPLPKPIVGLQNALVLSNQLAIDAALSGDRKDLLRAIVAHPLINSLNAAEHCMDALLEREADWLPQFAGRLTIAAVR